MPYAGVNGQRLYYEVGGDGDTVVLLHGAFADADIMEAPATGLATGLRAIRIDRRGHGRSILTGDEPISFADEANDVRALLDWFSVTKTSFVTHGEGAEIAIEFALRYPERTEKLVLLSPMVDGFPWVEEAAAARAQLLQAYRADVARAVDERFLTSRHFDVVNEHEGMIERVGKIYRRGPGTAYRHDRPPRPEGPLAGALGAIAAPTCILVGDRDDSEWLRCAEGLAVMIPGAQHVVLHGLGHFLHVEDSRQVMRRLTDVFIPEPEIEP